MISMFIHKIEPLTYDYSARSIKRQSGCLQGRSTQHTKRLQHLTFIPLQQKKSGNTQDLHHERPAYVGVFMCDSSTCVFASRVTSVYPVNVFISEWFFLCICLHQHIVYNCFRLEREQICVFLCDCYAMQFCLSLPKIDRADSAVHFLFFLQSWQFFLRLQS